MITSRFSLSVFASLVIAVGPARALPTSQSAKARTEIERIVTQEDTTSATTEAKAWIEGNRPDKKHLNEALIAGGFRSEQQDRPYPGCSAYTYLGRRERSGQEIIASFVICPEKPPIALITTLLPVSRDPNARLPPIKPPISGPSQTQP
jgi:hypothetical protein